MEEKLLTLKQAAKYLQVSEMTIKRHLYSGRLKGYKAGKVWRIKFEDLQDFLKENK